MIILSVVIQTGVRSLEGVEAVGHSLDTLTVVGCELTRIEDCVQDLIRLRRLFLQENRIGRVENLENCRQLEELWLFSNQVANIENLDSNSMLRELNLADNKIKKIGNLSRLINLQTLDLSGNPIASLSEIDKLKELPILEQLSFSSPLFEASPIAALPDYKSYITKTLTNFLKLLDGTKLSLDHDSHKEYISLVSQMNSNISAMECSHSRKLLQLDSELKVNEDALNSLRDKCVQQLEEVKTTTEAGREKIESEQEQAQKLRKVNEEKLLEDLEDVMKEYKNKVNEMIKEEESKLSEGNKVWDNALEEAEFEKVVYESLINVMFRTNGKVLYAEIEENSPEFFSIQSHFSKLKSTSPKILSACLIYNGNSAEAKTFSYATLDLASLEPFLEGKISLELHSSLEDCLKSTKKDSIIAMCKSKIFIHALVILSTSKAHKEVVKDERLGVLVDAKAVWFGV
eukprot:TRINITY_DN12262_c0_g6_i1.p1 TRINITY_DN12262_c0_g6~~TRINITY_DN12262_c0_g6_i1.p1  ORF type:complete len:459 (-),score=117.87 TRINITY_DN12262_c0_g6_i1:358-1734(-)